MNRRELMQALTAAFATAAAPELLVGTATAGGLAGRQVGLEDIPELLAALDAQVERLRARALPPVIERFYAGLGLRPSFPHDVAESMLRIATFRDLPRRVQAHPELQRRVRAELPRLGQQVLAMAAALRDLPRHTRDQIQRLLQRNPALPHAIRERRRAILTSAGAPPERVEQIDRLMERLFFRLQRQHPSLLIDELVDKVRHVSLDAGAEESTWGALIAADLDAEIDEPDGDLVLFGEAEVEAAGWTGDEGGDEPRASASPTRLRRAASILFKIGGLVAGAGALMFLLGLAIVDTSLGVALTIIGPILVIAGLLVLGVGLMVYLAAPSEEQDAEADDLVLPDELIAAIRAGDTAWLTEAGAPA